MHDALFKIPGDAFVYNIYIYTYFHYFDINTYF
jgi:hypothetical protein